MVTLFSTEKSFRGWTLATLSSAAVLLSSAAFAQGDASGSARISVGGKLRFESQSLMAKACTLAVNGEASPISSEDLRTDVQLFQQKIDALRNGDMALALREPETGRRVLSALDKVEAAWQPVSADLASVADGYFVEEALTRILVQGKDLVDTTGNLLAILSGAYSNSENFSFGAALAVNIVDRQTVLLEEMSLHDCVAQSETAGAEESNAALAESIKVFDASMEALINGQPQVGLMEPPTDGVRNSLGKAQDVWSELKPMVAAGESTSAAAGELRVSLQRELNNARLLYLLATSKQPDLYRIPLEAYANDQLARWLLEPQIVISLREQNTAHKELSQEAVDEMDLAWRADAEGDASGIVAEMMARPLSELLKRYQLAANGIVTEVFIMDDKGLNVAQSAVTSDLWQGDEAKWQETYASEGLDYHFSDVEFDDSTGFYQVQVSMPIADPVTQEKLGAVTFGVNIQSLL
ncbi:type IV pili methyl-accepting chemotaxis transducer N-terminal domain-containing protein [Algicella marina]|uniref:type IV pili methyl-accepting chemotaxis transducer N-terminal domain-containing protein n=1 Tax=Algicella marina TaxID=2683284 RepID=UPI00137AA7B3|nr:type IV pili methyl-accepting chemotaxis transducer N-terminal domain-containing protein [Algicella marina]